jgi:hypothetical protein
MISNLIYALVIAGSTGEHTTLAHFANRSQCLIEAQKIIEQGPAAYCLPTNQPTEADIQRHFDHMIVLLKRFRTQMDTE